MRLKCLHSVALASLLLAAPAFAADFTSPMLGADDKPIPACADKTPECSRPLTLADVAQTALYASYPDEVQHPVDPLEKFKRAQLALAISANPQLGLSAEQTSQVKNLIGKAWAPIIVFRAWTLLDPDGSKALTK